jgi:hypothetical protein
MGVMTGIALGMAVGGTVLNVIGKVKSGNAQKKAADADAAVAERRAIDVEEAGQEEEARFRAGVRGLIGKQRVGFAAQGVEVSSGSAVDVQADAAYLGELDAIQIKNNAAREAWGIRQDAESMRKSGSIARSESRWGAASSILSTGGSLIEARYGFRADRKGKS